MTNDFSLDTSIEFLENDSGDIVLTPVELDDIHVYITDHNDNPITTIDPDEVYVAIITEDQGRVLVQMNQTSMAKYN